MTFDCFDSDASLRQVLSYFLSVMFVFDIVSAECPVVFFYHRSGAPLSFVCLGRPNFIADKGVVSPLLSPGCMYFTRHITCLVVTVFLSHVRC